jgi:hypothetical protein
MQTFMQTFMQQKEQPVVHAPNLAFTSPKHSAPENASRRPPTETPVTNIYIFTFRFVERYPKKPYMMILRKTLRIQSI